MKNIAALALLGLITFDQAKAAHFEVTDSLSSQEKLYMAMNEESDSDDSDPDDDSDIQVGKVIEDSDSFNGWHAHMEEFPGTVNEYGSWIEPYKREVPERFAQDAAENDYYPVDKFTQNMIKNHAIEGVKKDKNKLNHQDPERTHRFYLTKDAARRTAVEILGTHFGMQGAEANDYLASHFEDAWNYYDVNSEGRLDAVGSSSFFRFLTKRLGELDLQ